MSYYSAISTRGREVTYSVISASNMQNAINYYSNVDLSKIRKLTTTTVDAGSTFFFTALYEPNNINIVCQANTFLKVYFYMQDLVGGGVTPLIRRINSIYYTTT